MRTGSIQEILVSMQILEEFTHGDGKSVFRLESCLESNLWVQTLKRMQLKGRVLI